MSERYTRLFSLPENLYAVGAPAIIAAGALLKDNQTGNVLAQLKLRSISSKTIKAATVSIKPLDTAGLSLGNYVTYQYLDLQVDRDTDFGQKTAIPLTNPATRSFGVIVSEAIFTDNSIWHGDDQPWEALAEPKNIDFLGDKELTKQFRMEYGGDCKNLLLEQKDLWHCVCGAINHREEMNCHLCYKVHSELLTIDIDDLEKKKEERLAGERVQSEKAKARAQKEIEIAQKKTIRNCAIIGSVAAFVVAVILIGNVLKRHYEKLEAYKTAVALMEEGQYEKAITAFESMSGYKDSAQKAHDAANALVEKAYSVAVEQMNMGEYAKAIASFGALEGYKDSNEKAYDAAVALIQHGNFKEAISAFQSMDGYDKVVERVYDMAMMLMDDRQYKDAVAAFKAVDGYKDSTEHVRFCTMRYNEELLESAQPGDYVSWGTYEQDNNLSNGAENIAWLVLERTDEKLFIISKYALDSKPYSEKDDSASDYYVAWENCTLRKWLNEDFLNTAFSSDEQAKIETVTVSADKNPVYDQVSGNSTQDKIFLLSIPEVERYFTSESTRQCKQTSYAYAQSNYAGEENGNCVWWLRTPGNPGSFTFSPHLAAVIEDGGWAFAGINFSGKNIALTSAVRPALWLNLEK